MTRWLRTGSFSACLALAALSAACGGSVAAEGPAAATAEGVAVKAPIATGAHGRVKIAAEALGEVPLRADQRAQIEKLAASAEAGLAPVHAAHNELLMAIATQVASGQLDRAALQPKIDAISVAAASAQVAERSNLEQLHGILDASQRTLFVDALRAKFQEKWQSHRGHGGWKGQWADLNLTDDQQTQIHAILHEQFAQHHGEMKGGMDRGDKVLEAFKGDTFSMDQAAPAMDAKAKASEHIGHMLDIATKVLPILTPEQRAAAAQKLQARAALTPQAAEEAPELLP